MTNKQIFTIIAIVLMTLFSIVVVSAETNNYVLLCLNDGETINLNQGGILEPWGCGGKGFCNACVIDRGDYYLPAHNGHCKGLVCENTGSTELDITPPELDLRFPVEGEVYDDKRVLFDFISDEIVSVSYLDHVNGKGRWKSLCSKNRCGEGYFKKIRFSDGLNDVSVRATDDSDNEVIVRRSFYVDATKPRIYRTYPRRGFADGLFQIQFKEMNPANLILNYGTYDDMREAEVDLDECEIIKGKTYCDIEVDLNDYDGMEISYWFELEDIAGVVVNSKRVKVEIDTTMPVLVNSDNFWYQGEGKYNKYIYFNFEIDELNFDEVVYLYEDSRGRTREKRLCSRLKDGVCEKKKSFRKGIYALDIQVRDDAGNAIAERIEFEVI